MATTSVGFDIFAKDRASATIDKIGKSADSSGHKFRAFGAAAKYAALGLAAGIGAAAVAGYKFAQSAAEDQQNAAILAKQMQNSAGATKAQVAATEDWITKQGVAFGVADDDLRPALGRLVAVTHDVGKAQSLTSLAMNVSAGTGKSLSTVTTALAKAQTGSISGLSRLGVATKDAAGNTLTLKQVTEQMSKTYTGQAAKAADTTQGKFERLKLAMSEAGESIGYKILPPLTAMATWLVGKGIPALGRFADWIGKSFGPPLRAAGQFVMTQIVPAIRTFVTQMQTGVGAGGQFAANLSALTAKLSSLASIFRADVLPAVLAAGQAVLRTAQFFNQHRTAALSLAAAIGAVVAITKIHSAVMAVQAAGGLMAMIKGLPIVTTLTKAWAAVQWALDAALNANPIGLVVVGIAALVAGVIIAYKHFDTFRAIVDKTFSFLKTAVSATIGFVKSHWQLIGTVLLGPLFLVAVQVVKHWNTIKSAFMGAISSVIGFVKSHWVTILAGLLGGPVGLAVALVVRNWDRIKAAFSAGITAAVGLVKSLPGKITSAIGNLGHLLWNAGAQVIQGLIDGVESKIGALTSKLHQITSMIPLHKGPITKDRVLLTPAGQAIMQGLIAGITKGEVPLKNVLDRVTANVQAAGDKLKGLMQARADFAAGFQNFASSIFGADTTGDGSAPTVDSILTFAASQRDQASQTEADVKRLVKMGLSKSLIKQMQSAGSSGVAQLHALASGASADQIKLLGSLDKQTQSDYAGAGAVAGGALFNDQIKQAQHDKHLADEIANALAKLIHGDKGEIHIHLEGHTLVESIRKHQRKQGQKPSV